MQHLKISGDATRGWRILFLDSVDGDSPIETFHHFALFADRRDAEDLLTKMRRAGFSQLDLRSHWSWEVDAGQTTGLSICGEAPTAVLETTPRPGQRDPSSGVGA